MTYKWYQVLSGDNECSEGPEQETEWVRDAFLAGFASGMIIASAAWVWVYLH